MISLEKLIELPFVQSFVFAQSIIYCIAPGLYLFWLSNPTLFMEMDFFKLIFLTVSLNLLIYMAGILLSAFIVLFEDATNFWLMNGTKESFTFPIGFMLQKSVLKLNMLISFVTVFLIFDFFVGKPITVDYLQVIERIRKFIPFIFIIWSINIVENLFKLAWKAARGKTKVA